MNVLTLTHNNSDLGLRFTTLTNTKFKKFSLFTLLEILPNSFNVFVIKKIKNRKVFRVILSNLKLFHFPVEKHREMKVQDAVRSVVFSKDGAYLGVGSWNCCATIFKVDQDFTVNSEPWVKLTHHKSYVFNVDFSFSNKYFATGSNDETVLVYSLRNIEQSIEESSKIKPLFSINQHSKAVNCVNFSPDVDDKCEYLASCGEDFLVFVYAIKQEKETFDFSVVHKLAYHTDYVQCVKFSPSGMYLASCSDDLSWNLVEIHSGAKIQEKYLTSYVSSITFSPCEQMIGVAVKKLSIVYVLTTSGEDEELIDYTFSDHKGNVNCISFSPSSDYFASASDDKAIIVYWSRLSDKKNFGRKISYWTPHDSYIVSINFSYCGGFFASGSSDKSIVVYR